MPSLVSSLQLFFWTAGFFAAFFGVFLAAGFFAAGSDFLAASFLAARFLAARFLAAFWGLLGHCFLAAGFLVVFFGVRSVSSRRITNVKHYRGRMVLGWGPPPGNFVLVL